MIDWDKVKKDKWIPKDGQNLRILSLDGGGIRGVFSATYLAKLEERLSISVLDYFDMIVGTSTGGIIALGLSIGIPAKELATLYLENAEKIFKPKFWGKQGILTSMYDNSGLVEILKQTFKDNTISDSKVMLCIPAVEHGKASPKVFKTPHDVRFFNDATYLMWKVAQATSAAPVYFPAAQTTDGDCKIDGGLWANNPVLVGITEGHILGYDPSRIKVLSIGTGNHLYSVDNAVAMESSLIKWKKNIVDLTMQVQTSSANYMAQHILQDRMIRIDCTTRNKIDLATTNKIQLQELIHEADEAFSKTYLSVARLFASDNVQSA